MSSAPFVGSALLDASHLAAHLQLLAGNRAGIYAVRLQILSGKHVARQPWPAAILREPLWALAQDQAAGLYTLADSDLVLLCKCLPVDHADEAVNRITRLFDNASLPGGGCPPTIQVNWYDLVRNSDFEALMSAAEAAGSSVRRRFVQEVLRPITIADLPAILDRMHRFPLARMIRRQSVLLVHSPGKLLPLFEELYVSIGEFQRAFAPGIDTIAQPALFRYLSESFDRRLLAHLVEEENANLTRGPFTININLSSTMLPIFSRFEEAFANRDDVRLEVHLDNILDDIETYHLIRRRLRKSGFGLVLGGVKSANFIHLDLAGFEADLIKVPCPGTGRFDPAANAPRALKQSLDRIGRDRVIFARLETEERLKWALGIGVSRFQGRFVDTLIGALATKGLLNPAARA